MGDERTGSCICCQQRDPLPELAPVCGPCRSRLRGQLVDIPDLCTILAAGPRPELVAGPSRRLVDVVVQVLDDGRLHIVTREHTARPVTINAGAIPGPPGGPRVAAAGDAAPIPVRLDILDLLAPADERTVHERHTAPVARTWCDCDEPHLHKAYRRRAGRAPSSDQVGQISAATILDGWCRDLADIRREHGPAPHVAAQCRYLSDRLDWAYTEHPAVDELATEIGHLWSVLRRAAGLAPPQPELCEGVPCRNLDCDLKTLYRVPGSRYIECASCGMLLTDEEYDRWVKLLAAAVKRPRSAA